MVAYNSSHSLSSTSSMSKSLPLLFKLLALPHCLLALDNMLTGCSHDTAVEEHPSSLPLALLGHPHSPEPHGVLPCATDSLVATARGAHPKHELETAETR